MTSMPTLFWTDAERAIDLDQVRLPLRVDVAQQLGDPQRELALLTLLALLDQRPHAADDVGVRRRTSSTGASGRRRRGG